VIVDGLKATGAYRAALSVEGWAAEPIGRVTLRDVDVEFTGGGTEKDAAIEVKSPGVDARPLPAWGLYARNLKQLDLQDVRLGVDKVDARPVMIAEDVGTLVLDGVRFADGAKPPVLRDVREVRRGMTDWEPKTEKAHESR
jgi:hypothetical protein